MPRLSSPNVRWMGRFFDDDAAWYRKAADQGDAAARNDLGSLYGLGNGPVPTHLHLPESFTGNRRLRGSVA